jgi:histone H1/5
LTQLLSHHTLLHSIQADKAEKPETALTKTKTGRVTKTTKAAPAKKAAAPKKAAPKKAAAKA